MKKLILIFSVLGLMCGCGGGSSTPPAISVSLAPAGPASIDVGQTVSFTATVSNDSSSKGVTWSVSGTGCSGAACGTLTNTTASAATYNAPSSVSSSLTVSVKATSAADTTKSASSTVTVNPAPSITTTSLPNGNVGTSYNQTLQASGGTGTLTWSVATGSPPANLSLSSSGVISGTRTATGTSPFTVNVTDSAPTPLSAQQPLSITINPPLLAVISTSLPNGVLSEAYTATVAATGGTPPYSFSISGGTFPTWGTLDPSTGAITGTPDATGTSPFTVMVTDSSTPTAQTATRALNLTINPAAAACTSSGNEAVLTGQYAFSLSGFTGTGFLAVVGSFTADGTGAITTGEADTNGVLGAQTGNLITAASSHSVGSDNRGCATLATPFGTFITRFALGSLSSGVATEGRLIQWEAPTSSAYIAAGHILQQTASSFSGSYAFKQTGADNGRRVGGVGVVSASSGSFTDGELDINDGGNAAHIAGMTGTYTSADADGRFTIATLWTGMSSPSHAVMYMVSSSQSLLMTTDDPTSNAVMAGEIQQQTGTFSNSSVNGYMVFYMTGLPYNGPPGARVEFGLLNANGTSSLTATDYDDEAGAWDTPNPATVTCTYSVASNGRMTLGGASCGGGTAVYLTAANQGFMLNGDPGVGLGHIEPQVGRPFSASSFSGAMYFGTIEPVNQAEQTYVGLVTLDGSGGYSSIADEASTTQQRAGHSDSGTVTVNSDGTLSASGLVAGVIISSAEFFALDNITDTYPIMYLGKQ